MVNEVYITKAGKFLPNQPISNDEMEGYLGMIHDQPSKSKRIVLRNNGIKSRHYAMDRSGIATHTNSQMAALAIRNMLGNDAQKLQEIDLLSCGTSASEQMLPSHAVMVHGWLPETNAIEVVSPSGACCSGMHAFKYAWMAVKLGQAKNAVATGSERLSRIMRADSFEEEANKLAEVEVNPYIHFDKEFLRWMLSDGAASVLLNNKKNETGISLRVDWLEGVSYAHELEPCMYMACEKIDGHLRSYMDYSMHEIIDYSLLSMKQDVKLLSENIVELGITKLKSVLESHNESVNDISYFLPHMSSEFFRRKISEKLEELNIPIPQEKWFTNLSKVGNVGAGSVYLMIEELFNSGKLKHGEKIVLLVPESARFSYMYALLTVC